MKAACCLFLFITTLTLLVISMILFEKLGEPIKIFSYMNRNKNILVIERLPSRNFAVVRIGYGDNKIVSDLPAYLERGDVFVVRDGKIFMSE